MAVALTSGVLRGSLYGLGFLLLGISVIRIRSGVANGQINLRPAYLLGLAAIVWFLAWRTNSFAFPTVAHAIARCETGSTSVWIKEGGVWVVHVVQTAGCSPLSISTTASTSTSFGIQ
jgi:hypothetical protein